MLRIYLLIPRNLPLSFVKYVTNIYEHLYRIKDIYGFELIKITYINRIRWLKSSILHIPYLGRGAFPPISYVYKAKRRDTRIVVTLHGFDSHALRRLFKYYNKALAHEYCSLRQLIIDCRNMLLWRILGSLIDMVITPTELEKRNLVNSLKIPHHKICSIPHGVDHSRYKPYPSEECIDILKSHGIDYDFILHVSSYQPKKGIENIIAAFALLKRKFNIKERLVIVGKHPKERLLRLAIRLGLRPSDVVFTGFIPEDHLPCLYSFAKVFVFPSFHESFGMPILEAMACGCPVVTSAFYACREVAGDAAVLVNPFNVRDIAFAIHRLLVDEELRQRLKVKGLERARKFTWRRSALMHFAVYRAVVRD